MNRAPLSLLLIALFLTGCLKLKPTEDQTRFFILSTTPAVPPVSNPSGEHWAVGIGAIEIPEYLQTRQMVQRSGGHEIRYFSNLGWAERMDKALRRVLIANLNSQLGSTNTLLTAWRRSDVRGVLAVTFERFESDETGQANLQASWRINDPAGAIIMRDGSISLSKPGSPMHTDPGGTVAALSDLLGQLAQAIASDLRQTLGTSSGSK